MSNPETHLLNIFNFLNFECADTQSLTTKINPQKMNRWKKTLTTRQIKIFEAVAFDCLKKHGYETQNELKPHIYAIEKTFYKLHHLFKLGWHLVKENIFKPLALKLNIIKPFNEKN